MTQISKSPSWLEAQAIRPPSPLLRGEVVLVGGTGVFVDGTCVAVVAVRTGVLVGGTAVFVGGICVAVGAVGTGVLVGGSWFTTGETGVAVAVGPQPATRSNKSITKAGLHLGKASIFSSSI
jgi:hypothetical protein